MKRTIFAGLFLCCLLSAGSGCSKPANSTATASASPGAVAATVGGAAITMTELDQAAKKQLQRVETEIYQVKKQVLDDMIDAKLLEQAAKQKGLDAEKYLALEVGAKIAPPTEEEIKALYDSSKERLGKPLEEVRGQIEDYLKQNRTARARADLLASLRQQSPVKINLEPPRVELNTDGAPAVGDRGAKITFVEFSDYQCPYCQRVRASIWRILDEYKGKVRYVFMDFPLSFHRDAKKAHEAAYCAGDQNKYFEYNRKLFENQKKLGVEDLKKYARELQLNAKSFDACLESGKHAGHIEEMTNRGMAAGVSGTPAYFINGIMLSGALPYEAFRETIESELKR